MRRLAAFALMLAGCSKTVPTDAPPADLEQAAIAAGVIRDPADTAITGLYARDTDRLCIVPVKARLPDRRDDRLRQRSGL